MFEVSQIKKKYIFSLPNFTSSQFWNLLFKYCHMLFYFHAVAPVRCVNLYLITDKQVLHEEDLK